MATNDLNLKSWISQRLAALEADQADQPDGQTAGAIKAFYAVLKEIDKGGSMPKKQVENPVVPHGILLRGLNVLWRYLLLERGSKIKRDVGKATSADRINCVMRIMQIGAVAERGGWKAEVRYKLENQPRNHPVKSLVELLEYGLGKDRADKRKPQGLGGITFKPTGRKKNKTGQDRRG